MTNLPKALRDQLRTNYLLHGLELIREQGSRDTTQKFLWRLTDHALIESVLIPANPALYGEASDRHTLCVSTQVGCAYGCKFCASGLEGLKRNLSVEEIVEQVLAVEREAGRVGPGGSGIDVTSTIQDGSANSQYSTPDLSRPRLVSNLVIMGMVKPLAALSRRLHAKVNLIPYNKVEGLAWERPSEAAQQAFLAALQEEKVLATLRREKGHDIDAACGQLRLRTERLWAANPPNSH